MLVTKANDTTHFRRAIHVNPNYKYTTETHAQLAKAKAKAKAKAAVNGFRNVQKDPTRHSHLTIKITGFDRFRPFTRKHHSVPK